MGTALRLAMSGCVVMGVTAWAPAADWKLVFEDDFERAEPGELYRPGDRSHQVSILDGQLLIVGAGASVMIDRSFPADIRVEFDSAAWSERPPCDLSVMLSSVYLLGFGARSNRANHLMGPGLHVVDEKPPFVIEPGKRYHMVAQREGKRITYTVNGTTILDGTSDKLMGGPSFDRVGLITWAGMLVDNLKIYARSEPHPDTPRYITSLPGLPLEREGRTVKATGALSQGAQAALDALNGGDYGKARGLFEKLDDVTLRMAGLAHLYGDLDYCEKPVYGDLGASVDFGELGAFAEQWAKQVEAHPDNATLKAYLPAVKHFGRLALSRQGTHDATVLVTLGPEHNPFYHKAKLFMARYTFWNGMEGGSEPVKNQARDVMRELIKTWPDNRVLREYVGEPIPWGEELIADTEHHPAWAAYLREAYAREVAVLERFCDARQRPEGQFGGGWGDDVEMMRRWVPIAAISNCSTKVLDGIAKLTEGVWKHATVNGYAPDPGDVEHSAEPSADAFPTMLLLRHGDPRYHEFNLASCRTIRNVMMGIDNNGFPRFKSTEIGATSVNDQLIGGGDTGYHARAMKHFFWLAWYGNAEATDWYVRWADGWRHTVMIDEPNKPAGLAPGTIWYPSGSYYPPNDEPWYGEKAANYYGPAGLPMMIHQSLLAAYSLSGERKFLRPVQRMMDHATYGPYQNNTSAQPPSIEWARQGLVHQADRNITSLYRALTGERVYDEYTKRFGTAPQVYQIDQDVDKYMERIEAAAKSLRHNLWYFTTEVESTDRLHLPAVEDVWGAYSGAVSTTVDAETPTMGVTYETPDANFAALVTENTTTRLRVWLYSFWDKPTEITLKLWRLTPGEYLINQGELRPGERPFQHRYQWGEPDFADLLHQGELFKLTLPPKTVWVVDFRLNEEMDVPESACDLAIAERDVRTEGQKLIATIHNIGNAPAEGFSVALRRGLDEYVTIQEQTVEYLSPPVDFKPFTATVTFDLPKPLQDQGATARLSMVVDPGDELFELCETNNAARVP